MKFKIEPLEKVCNLIIDCPHSTPLWLDKGIVVIRNTNIRNGRLNFSKPSFTNEENYLYRSRRAKIQENDIIFTREAPMGEVCIIPKGLKACLGQRQVLLRVGHDIDPKYLFYALQSPYVQHQISWNEGTGTTVSNVRIPVLKSLNIPRLGTMEIVVARTLESIDNKIELNRKMNQTLEEMAQVLFKSWFVDFDPVHARANSKESDEVMARELGISVEVLKLFPSAFVESELGLIPEGWEVKKLEDIITVNPKYTLKKGTVAKYVELRMLSTSLLSVEGYIDREFKGSGSRFQNNDTIFVRITPSLENGKRGFVDFLEDDEVAWGSTEYMILRGKSSNLREWVYILSISDNFRNFAIANMNGSSGRQRVPREVIESLLIVVPSSDILDIFSKQAKGIFSQIKLNSQEIQALQQTRDLLLPKLLSGEVDVSKIEEKK